MEEERFVPVAGGEGCCWYAAMRKEEGGGAG